MTRILMIFAAALMATAPMAEAKGPKGQKFCPPGLAKKTPECIPPGLAKKNVTVHPSGTGSDTDDEAPTFVTLGVGDRVIFDGQEYVVIATDGETVLKRGDDFYRLPYPGDGSQYVRIGDAIVKVDQDTKNVIDFIRLADLIFS